MFNFIVRVLAFYELINFLRKVRQDKENDADETNPPKPEDNV